MERILLLLWMGLLVEYGWKDVYSFNKIHIVQMVVIDLCAEHLAFPLSFVVAVVGIYVYAIIVNSISTQVRRIVEKIVIRKKKVKI